MILNSRLHITVMRRAGILLATCAAAFVPLLTAADKAAVGRDHWAFRPLTRPQVPAVKNQQWARTDVDRFILARQESTGLEPNPRIDARRLIRRVYFDLTGLPPTPEEIDAFVKDSSPRAYEKLITKLLDSPRYGERWGRHWLDLALRGQQGLPLRRQHDLDLDLSRLCHPRL